MNDLYACRCFEAFGMCQELLLNLDRYFEDDFKNKFVLQKGNVAEWAALSVSYKEEECNPHSSL